MSPPSETEAVLAANRAFYTAFRGRDVAAMDALWAHRLPVCCIHPGWDALTVRNAVMASWREILTGPGSPEIECQWEQVLLLGEVALVVCHEVIGRVVLAATNAFAREDTAWRMVHHQASHLANPPPLRPRKVAL
ncbi:MAG: nuclear transport factor 2 family protein [Burkholderiales bacterium]